ncbi:MAG: hypothetical protein INR73_13295 [Williamsia sp.]|nr:hypothetical protein [Williamsia sp.]
MNEIILPQFDDPAYSLMGHFICVNPVEFTFTGKFLPHRYHFAHEVFSTKLITRIIKEGEKSSIVIFTKTNPLVYVLYAVIMLSMAGQLLKNEAWKNNLFAIIYLVALPAIVTWIDVFVKRQLVAWFENDCKPIFTP